MLRSRSLWAATGILILLLGGLASPRLRTLLREHRLRTAPRPFDVVLLTLDTTRADRLGCYGARGADTPNLDALAARGARFLNAYSHVPLTCPSHASILTGLIPPRHGVHDNGGFALGDGPRTLAEVFVDAGYRTGAFVSAFVLDRRFGLGRGFATYEDDVETGNRDDIEASVRASVTVDRAVRWLRADRERPIFLWTHFYDPHRPYEPPEPFATRFRDRLYEGEVAYMDSEIGRLLAAVAERGRPTLVVAVGDHGESLGEHGELAHNYFIYGATQRVPLLLSLPGYLPRGQVVAPVVRAVDVMPTILDAAGLAVPGDLDGRSLVPLITGRSSEEPGPAYLESYHPRFWWGARELLGLRTGPWLFIHSLRPELYRPEEDPGETRDLSAQNAAEMERLRLRLEALKGKADPLEERRAVDSDAEARLRSLGYLGAAGPSAGGDLPDAKDNTALLSGATRANELLAAGRKAEALEAYRETLKLNPRSTSIRASIANLLLEIREPGEAFQLYAELWREDPRNENAVLGMARSLFLQGKSAEALKALREGISLLPRSASLREDLGRMLLAAGRLEEARDVLQECLSLDARRDTARLLQGVVLTRLRELPLATTALLAVVERNPRSAAAREAGTVLKPLGDALLAAGNPEQGGRAYQGAIAAGLDDEPTYLNLGLALYRGNHRAQALEAIRAGLARHPQSADLHYRAGRLLQEAGRASEARDQYREVLALAPQRDDARKALQGIEASPR
jgi:choline-sulfatase